jgi:hypothetical protein
MFIAFLFEGIGIYALCSIGLMAVHSSSVSA